MRPLEKEAARGKVVDAIREPGLGRQGPLRPGQRLGHEVDRLRRHRGRRQRRRAARRDHAAQGADRPPRSSPSTCCSPRSRPHAGLPVGHIGIEAQIETARGLINVEEICAASPRLETIIFGPADFAASMEMPVLTGGVQIPEYPGDHFHYVFSKILMAGPGQRAAGHRRARTSTSATPTASATTASAPGSSATTASGRCTPTRSRSSTRCSRPTQEQFDRAWDILDAYRDGDRGRGQGRGHVRRRDDRRGQPQDGAPSSSAGASGPGFSARS